MADTQDPTESSRGEGSFSAAERAAMAQRAAELKAQAKGGKGAAKKEREAQACLDAIAALEGTDKAIAETFHAIMTEEAPHLDPKTWYGFPSYARDGNVIAFVTPASKFDDRYASIGFNSAAQLDDGTFWATSFAVLEITPAVEEQLRGLVRRAAG